MNLRVRVRDALVLLLAIALVARVVWALLGPLVPVGIALTFVSGVLVFLLRGLSARR